MTAPGESASIRVTAIVEATQLTGPARNLLDLAMVMRNSGTALGGSRPVTLSLLTFARASTTDAAHGQSMDNAFTRAFRAAGVAVDQVGESGRFDLSMLRRLRAAIDAQRPHIVETHSVKSHFLGGLLNLSRARPWLAYHHGYTTTDVRMRVYNQLDRWSLRRADRVVSVCGAFRDCLVDAGMHRDRIRVVHSSIAPGWGAGATIEAARNLKEQWQVAVGERVILSVGRLSREKGHVDLIRAFGLLQASAAGPVRLVMVGEGPERRNLEAETARLGIARSVIFAGHLDDVRHCYRAADVFVLPSHSEGSPIALLEAMSSGTPVVATRVGGVPEMLTALTGMLVEPRAPKAMATAVVTLLADSGHANRIAGAACAHARAHHSPELRAATVAALYREVLGSC